MPNRKKTLVYVWIILVVLTAFAYLLGYLKMISTALVAVLLFTTLIKGVLISDYFMGLKDIKMKYRLIPVIWLGVIIVCIAVAYYLPVETAHTV